MANIIRKLKNKYIKLSTRDKQAKQLIRKKIKKLRLKLKLRSKLRLKLEPSIQYSQKCPWCNDWLLFGQKIYVNLSNNYYKWYCHVDCQFIQPTILH